MNVTMNVTEMNTTYYTSTELEPSSTTFFTTNEELTVKEAAADTDFYYIWIIMFSLFTVISSTIAIQFGMFHFGRIKREYQRPDQAPASDAGKTRSMSDEHEHIEMIATETIAALEHVEHADSDEEAADKVGTELPLIDAKGKRERRDTMESTQL